MTKVHGKRYAYKFDFQGLAAATQPAAADPAAYKYQSELFMSGYGHAKLNLMPPPAASVSVSVPGGLFQSASSYWSTSPGANLYAGHHTASGHVPPHLGSYPHYAWPAAEHWGALGTPRWKLPGADHRYRLIPACSVLRIPEKVCRIPCCTIPYHFFIFFLTVSRMYKRSDSSQRDGYPRLYVWELCT